MVTNEANQGQGRAAITRAAAMHWKTRLAVLGPLWMGSMAAVLGLLSSGCMDRSDQAKPSRGAAVEGGWRTAQLTTFTSFPACCPESPVYDPNAPTEECDDYSGCDYMGEFAAIGKKSFQWVKSHDVIAFYDDDDPDGSEFHQKYGGRRIKLRKNGEEFEALIADTCGNYDCDGCCSENSKGGYLVDVELWTAKRRLGGAENAFGTIEFQILGPK